MEAHVDLLRQPPAGAPRAGGADGLRPRGDPHLGARLRRRGGRQAAEGRRRQAGLLGRLQELTDGEGNCALAEKSFHSTFTWND